MKTIFSKPHNAHRNQLARLLSILILVFLSAQLVFGQSSSDLANPKRGAAAGASFSLSEIENINLTNGNLMLNLPLVKTPPARGGISAAMGLVYNSKLYDTIILEQLDSSNQITDQYFPKVADKGGWQAFNSLSYQLKVVDRFEPGVSIPCEPGVGAFTYAKNAYRWKVLVAFPDGSEKAFIPVGYSDPYGDGFYRITPNGSYYSTTYTEWSQPPTAACNTTTSQATTGPMVYYSTDGSYTRLVVDHDPNNGPGNGMMNDFTLYFPDGSKYEKSEARLTDRNGNYIEAGQFTYNGSTVNGIVDQLGRKLLSVPSLTHGESHLVQSGFAGEELVWTIRRKTVYVRRPFKTNEATSLMQRGGSSDQIAELEHDVVYEVQLPTQYGDLKYQFDYYASDTPLTSGYSEGWGEIKSITMPSGAVSEYEYKNDAIIYAEPYTKQILANSVAKKTLKHLAEYDGGSTLQEDVWTYSINSVSATVTAPDGSETTQSHGDTSYEHFNNGLVRKIESSNGTKVEKIWAANAPSWGGGAQPNPFVKQEFTSIKDASGNYVLTAIKEFTQDKNGNVTSVKEYDYVPYGSVPRTGGIPTGLPSGVTPIRAAYTAYHNAVPDSTDTTTNATYAYWNFGGVKGVAASAEVRNSANQTVSKSEITYDNPSTTANPTLTRVWDSTKGAVSTPLTQYNSVETVVTYNSYGAPLTTTDANGNVTQLTYGAVQGPDGVVYDLYPTQTDTAHGTEVARTLTSTYDFHTGLVTSITDEDNNLTNSIEYDDLGRPVKAITADGTTLESWIVTEYHDAGRYVVTKADLENKGDGKRVAIQHFDQLGRVRLSRTLENAATESPSNEQHGIKVQTRYLTTYSSPNGYNYSLTSNPYRAANSSAASTEPTMGWTRSKAHHLGRHSEVETFSGSALPEPWGSNTSSTGVVQTDIDANVTTVTDQAGKVRRSVTNGLGQLVRVDEPTGSGLGTVATPNQATGYAYDTLGNLTTVTQGVQTRTFTYSSLSRLLSATNPESGTINYAYDANGNLTTKTDARSIGTTYSYDALNRVTFRNYSDSTPDVTYTYDNKTNAYGKLTKVSSSVSTTEYTAFDILGRVTAHKQTTDGVDYTTGYSYNLSGQLLEQTYPSGRVVRNTFDTADGSLSQVQSKRSGETYRNFANGFGYNAAGVVEKMRLGNGLWENTAFNSRLQPTQIGLGNGANSQNLLKLEYEYGSTTSVNNGNVTKQTITVPGVAQPFIQSYTYDELNRLTNAEEVKNSVQQWEQTFTYDRFGNRNFDETNTTTLPKNCGTTPNFTVCTADKKIVNPSINTANNRLSTSDNYAFDSVGNTTGDAEGRTFVYDAENKQVSVSDANGTIGEYSYDGDGKRVKKYVPGTGELTVFVYDAGGKLIGEYSTVVQTGTAAKTVYTTNDHLGSPRINTDGIGQVVSRHDYHPFGEEIARTGYGADTVRKQFTGYERDGETGLDFAQARYFSRISGRFTSVDPIMINPFRLVDPQRINLYAYVRNNPLKYVDISGEDLLLANAKARKTFSEVRIRGLSPSESRNLVVGPDGKVTLRNPKRVNGSKTYRDLVSLINDQSSTVTVYTVGRNESVATSNGTVGGQEAYDSNGMALGPDSNGDYDVIIPEGGGVKVEVKRNGTVTKESASEDAIFWHEVIGHGRGNNFDETIAVENDYRASRNPALPPRTGTDHRILGPSNAPIVMDPVQTGPVEIGTEISPQKPIDLPKKPE